MRLHGNEAIAYAEKHNLQLCKYTDPAEESRDDLTIDEAIDISRQDGDLIYIDIEKEE